MSALAKRMLGEAHDETGSGRFEPATATATATQYADEAFQWTQGLLALASDIAEAGQKGAEIDWEEIARQIAVHAEEIEMILSELIRS